MELNFTRELTPAAVRASVPGVHDDPPGVRYEVVDLSQLPAAAGAAAGAESAAKADDAVAADGVARPDAAQQQQQDALAAGVDEVDAEGGVNFDSPGGRRRLLQSRGPPIGTVARENAETACLWLTEGQWCLRALAIQPCHPVHSADPSSALPRKRDGPPRQTLRLH